MKLERLTSWLAAVVVATVIASPLCGAQAPNPRRELVGVIRDPTGTPIEGATVDIKGATTSTNARGAFQLWTGDIDTLTLKVRRLGYYPIEAQINARNRQWDTVLVEMERNPQALAAMKINEAVRANGYRDFDERRRLGIGQFVTREDVE